MSSSETAVARVPGPSRPRGLGKLQSLPRDLALGRLGYGLKRPFFALPLYSLTLGGTQATTLAVPLTDPWPGNAEVGGLILDNIFALAGHSVRAPSRLWSPIGVEPNWLVALHGFDWLRDLRAVGGDSARRRARELVADWLQEFEQWDPLAWGPEVIGRRLTSWLGQYEFYAASADLAFRQRLNTSLGRQARHLSRVLPAGLTGPHALAACKGLIWAGVALADNKAALRQGLALLRRHLMRQILADGGHGERNPTAHLAVLRDLIDIRAALYAGGIKVPADLQTTIEQMAPMLRLFRHGDGGLALFNGADEAEGWQVEMALQRAGGRPRSLSLAPQSGFQRLTAGRTLVLVDAGRPPPSDHDKKAHAGTLSFEMSVGRERLIVNCGAHPAAGRWSRAYRATAAHSTLVVGDTNSSRVWADGGLGRRPETVTCRREEGDGSHWLDMSHDGYRPAFGLVHHRRLYLAAGGEDLRGEDRLEGPAGREFAIHFHLHPEVQAVPAQDGLSVLLRTQRGLGWRLRARGAAIGLEASTYLGRTAEPRRSLQLVLRGTTAADETRIKWAIRREDKD